MSDNTLLEAQPRQDRAVVASSAARSPNITPFLIALSVVFAAALMVAGSIVVAYFQTFGWPLPGPFVGPLPQGSPSPDPRDLWGTFGDYVGGSLNPLFAFFTFFGLVLTVMLQVKQLAISREQLDLAKLEQKEARAAAEAQLKLQREVFIESVMPALRAVPESGNPHEYSIVIHNDGADCGHVEFKITSFVREHDVPRNNQKSPPIARHEVWHLKLRRSHADRYFIELTVHIGGVGRHEYKFNYFPPAPEKDLTYTGEVKDEIRTTTLSPAWAAVQGMPN